MYKILLLLFIISFGFGEDKKKTNANLDVVRNMINSMDRDYKKNIKYDKKLSNINIFKDIFISIDRDLDIRVSDIFLSQKYEELNLRKITTEGSLDAINSLKKSKANIAIVRGDILGIKNNSLLGLEKYDNYGIICSPSSSVLYLISKKDIKSIDDMRGMRVSSGLSSNMAQLYLAGIAIDSGTPLDIRYHSLNLKESIKAIKKDAIDAIFMFAPEDYLSTFLDNNLKVISLPNEFFDNLKKKKGLNPHSYYIKKDRIRTVEVQNFLIAPKNTLDAKINLKIEAMVSAFECYNTIQNIDPFYGNLHEAVKPAITSIHERIDLEEAISFSFKSKSKNDGGVKYIYEVHNNSSEDMNITLKEFRTNSFDKIPIRPRHLITVVPSGDIELKKKSHKIITYIYKNPFVYDVKRRDIIVIYKNLTIKDSEDVEFVLSIGDN